MIKLYSHQNSTIVYQLKGVLESYDILCEIRNEKLAGVVGPYPPFDTWIELWIFDDTRYDEAKQILDEVLSSEETTGKSWKCSKCGEESESQFTECWNCGESRIYM